MAGPIEGPAKGEGPPKGGHYEEGPLKPDTTYGRCGAAAQQQVRRCVAAARDRSFAR